MKLIVAVALALVAVAAAGPIDQKTVETLSSKFESKPDGQYDSAFETSDGTSRSEQGEFKDAISEDNKPVRVLTVRGQYSFVDPEGVSHTIQYFADESGFHPEGESIPKVSRR